MTSSHSETVRTRLLPDQNPPRNPKTQKPSQFDSRRLAGAHHRQTTHQEKPKTGLQACVAWRYKASLPSGSSQEPKNT